MPDIPNKTDFQKNNSRQWPNYRMNSAMFARFLIFPYSSLLVTNRSLSINDPAIMNKYTANAHVRGISTKRGGSLSAWHVSLVKKDIP
ncbi:hypothetical protein [Gracilibacillus sp. JCM 18860]|uniref:hypothetical protein n=1 Tax=Gracilibacillus sp. JCM 18860 TaxID=1306159 RepID=UPI0032609722